MPFSRLREKGRAVGFRPILQLRNSKTESKA